MKKSRDRKLHLYRETVVRLTQPEVRAEDLNKVDGGSIVDRVSTTVRFGCLCVN